MTVVPCGEKGRHNFRMNRSILAYLMFHLSERDNVILNVIENFPPKSIYSKKIQAFWKKFIKNLSCLKYNSQGTLL